MTASFTVLRSRNLLRAKLGRAKLAPAVGLALATGLVLTGCVTGDPYQPPRFPFAAGYTAAGGSAPVLLTNTAWWERLGDPVLNRLVAQALQGNPSIEAAQARIAQARAAFAATPGAVSLSSEAAVQ